jgi:iron complex transport system permease protein
MSGLRWIFPGIFLVALFLMNLATGSVSIPFSEIISILLTHEHSDKVWLNIVWDFRMTKALTCVLAGSALSVSGLQMQTLFRNALAGPDVLGITSGASLAVSLIFMGHSSGFLFFTTSAWSIALAASLGCAGIFLIMLILSGRLQDNVSLLIIGLMVGAATSSIVSVLQYVSPAEDLQVYMIWTFGSLGSLNWVEIEVLTFILITGSGLAFIMSKALNAWFLGENYVQSLGINTRLSRLLIIFSACILTGGVTAFCGPLAFVGLAVPHLIKMFLHTHNHRILIPSVMAGGAGLLLMCDILSQLPGSNQILPINAITALIGSPIVIWVILKNRIVE